MSLLFRLMVAVIVISALPVTGQTVSGPDLDEMAVRFMNGNFPGGARKIREVISYDSLNSLKIFQLEPEGWLILSTDKKVEPVIGFSFTGSFKVPEKDVNNPMYNWFDLYTKQIRQIVNDRSLRQQKTWDTGEFSKGASAEIIRVKPFMKVTWDQGSGWNQFCPADNDGPGDHVYVGCVGVSMAQAMSIYKVPAKGTGSHNYLDPKYGSQYVNFANANYYWDSMSVSSPDKFNALLLYHCAVAVDMKFGADGSGTQALNAAAALRNYFSFSKNVLHKRRTGTVQEWHDIINNELLKGRPVIYAGDPNDGKPGHAFNIDGVMSSTYYHINWGWSGTYNGYFTIDALNPGANNFNENQSAIIGIQPVYYPTDIILTDTIVQEDLPSGTAVGKVKVIDEATDNSYTLRLTSDSTYDGSGWVRDYYLDGDSLRTGRTFTTADNRKDTIMISLTDRFNNKISKAIPLSIGSILISTGPENRLNEKKYFYPNPVGDMLYIEKNMPAGLKIINIYSLNGSKIQQTVISDYNSPVPVSSLKKGFYIIEAVFRNNTSFRQKFIKD